MQLRSNLQLRLCALARGDRARLYSRCSGIALRTNKCHSDGILVMLAGASMGEVTGDDTSRDSFSTQKTRNQLQSILKIDVMLERFARPFVYTHPTSLHFTSLHFTSLQGPERFAHPFV